MLEILKTLKKKNAVKVLVVATQSNRFGQNPKDVEVLIAVAKKYFENVHFHSGDAWFCTVVKNQTLKYERDNVSNDHASRYASKADVTKAIERDVVSPIRQDEINKAVKHIKKNIDESVFCNLDSACSEAETHLKDKQIDKVYDLLKNCVRDGGNDSALKEYFQGIKSLKTNVDDVA